MKSFFAKLRQLPNATAFGSCLHLPLAFAAYFLLDLSFRGIYSQWCATWTQNYIPLLFSVCWCLILCGIGFALPPKGRRVWFVLTFVVYAILVITHGVLINLFSRFFSFSDLSFAGDGAAFVDMSYLVIRKITLLAVAALALLMVLAALAVPKRDHMTLPCRLIAAAAALALGAGGVWAVRTELVGESRGIEWDQTHEPSAIYENWSDNRPAALLCGIYQYTWRDLCLSTGIFDRVDPEAVERLDDYFAAKPGHEENSMSGIFQGKNLLLVQLECIDTWMLQPEYMPALSAVKEQSISFENFYTPGFIAANTFNTEFIVNTGLLPATTGVSSSVYTKNSYPGALAALFKNAGYTSRSFHGIEGNIYDRLNIHDAWGYESYSNGYDMGMENVMFDSQLTSGFDMYAGGEDFFSFLITYSGHGPFSRESIISVLHYDEAREKVPEELRDNEAVVCAVSNAIETDLFVADLMEKLRESGALEDTVVVFYADHYSTYLMDTALNMSLKGAENEDTLRRTDFFIYSADMAPQTVDKPASTMDVLPTLANLFGLEADYKSYVGQDVFSDAPGFVFFGSRAYIDGSGYHAAGEPGQGKERVDELMDIYSLVLKTDYFGR